MMLHEGDRVDILHVHEHYEGRVNGQVVVSGDTWNEVFHDLVEMGYIE